MTLCPDATPLLGNNFRAGYDSSYRITKILVNFRKIIIVDAFFQCQRSLKNSIAVPLKF